MFCNFYFEGYSNFSEVKATVKRLSQGADILDSNDTVTISTDGFTISLSEGGHGPKFASEDYNIELKYSCYIDVIASYTNWAYDLMSFIGKVICDMDGDCILELNDKPILLRKNNIITVDDKNLSGTAKFPFHKLGLDYQEGDIL
ncbi:hypothetical protein M3231_18440 [Neobacillus mesonae]|nr:hypothetical protein [Neobacillus mesonae]